MGMISCQVYIHNNMVKLTQLVKIFLKNIYVWFLECKKVTFEYFFSFSYNRRKLKILGKS